MNLKKERKAFESQNFIKRLLGYSKYDEDRNEYVYFRFEDYAIRDTCELNTAWKAWQASANREGYKLVPVEMSWQKADELASEEWDKNKSIFCVDNRDMSALQARNSVYVGAKTKHIKL